MSRSSSDNNESLFAPILAPSGMFLCNYAAMSFYVPPAVYAPTSSLVSCDSSSPASTVYNPMPLEVRQSIKDAVSVETQGRFLSVYQGAKRCKLFERSQFDEYARSIFERLIPSIAQQKHDLILFPLRGSRQPGILTKLIGGLSDRHLVIFNYTYATKDSRQPQIRAELLEQLRQRLPEQQSVSLGIVDTANGGYGSRNLAQLLATLHREQFRNQLWTVQFHLLHARDGAPRLAREIPSYGDQKIGFLHPLFYEVDSLLVEDWDEGIGLAVQESRGYYELKRCVQPGSILYRDEDTVQVIESEELCNTMTGLMAEAVNRLMLNHPAVEYIKDVCDQEDIQKEEGSEE